MDMIGQHESELAQRSNFLVGMPQDVAEAILSRSTTRSFVRGATIFVQGQPARVVFVVLDGWVKLFRTAPSGGEAVVGVFSKGESFGEAVVMVNGTLPVTAEAVTDCRLLQVEGRALLDLVQRRPEIVGAILSSMYRHYYALVDQIEQLKAMTGPQRVAEFLLELVPVDDGECSVQLPYDKALIAGRLGMKPESLSRAFAQLRKAGLTVHQSTATIANVSELRLFANRDPALAWSKSG